MGNNHSNLPKLQQETATEPDNQGSLFRSVESTPLSYSLRLLNTGPLKTGPSRNRLKSQQKFYVLLIQNEGQYTTILQIQ